MNNASKSGNLVSALAQNRAKIEDSIPWKELGDTERVDRIRNYIKSAIAELKINHQRETTHLQEQINKLQKHRHNEKGEAYVEHKLQAGEDNERGYGVNLPPIPSATSSGWMSSPIHEETEIEDGNGYI